MNQKMYHLARKSGHGGYFFCTTCGNEFYIGIKKISTRLRCQCDSCYKKNKKPPKVSKKT